MKFEHLQKREFPILKKSLLKIIKMSKITKRVMLRNRLQERGE